MGRSWSRIQGNFARFRQKQEVRRDNDQIERIPQQAQGFALTKKIIAIGFFIFTLALSTENYASPTDRNVKVHNQTEYFIDIEASVDQLKIDCSGEHLKSGNYYMGLDIFDGKEVYSFYYRRPLNQALCKEEEREYQKMLENAKTVRIVGISSRISKEPPPKHFKNKHPNKTFASVPVKWTTSVFIRLQVEKKCKAYFANHCDLPKNYWANTIPPK